MIHHTIPLTDRQRTTLRTLQTRLTAAQAQCDTYTQAIVDGTEYGKAVRAELTEAGLLITVAN